MILFICWIISSDVFYCGYLVMKGGGILYDQHKHQVTTRAFFHPVTKTPSTMLSKYVSRLKVRHDHVYLLGKGWFRESSTL